MSSEKTFRYYWHADRCNASVASVRLRLLQPVRFLRRAGFSIDTGEVPFDPSRHDAVLFCKSVSDEALEIARRAKMAGKKILYDICDNVFAGKENRKTKKRSYSVREMMNYADIVSFTTETLRDQIIKIVHYNIKNTIIIPDFLDVFIEKSIDNKNTKIIRSYCGVKKFIQENEEKIHCIWFGKSQGNKSGICHIGNAVNKLEEFSKIHPVTLTVISNRPFRYWMYSRKWKIPHHYENWNSENFGNILSLHDIAIIPLEKNEYTIGKTINRPAAAIMAGLGVVADSIPAYEELRQFINLDDWESQLDHYRLCSPKTDPDLNRARIYLENRYGEDNVGKQWANVLKYLS